MDTKGYELITEAFLEADIDAVVQPSPEEGEDVRFINIVPEAGTHSPAQVLNALARAGFIHIENYSDQSPLALRTISTTYIEETHSILLEDMNAGSTEYDH